MTINRVKYGSMASANALLKSKNKLKWDQAKYEKYLYNT